MHKGGYTVRFVIGMLIFFTLHPYPSAAEAGPAAAPLVSGAVQSGTVRVRLLSLGNPSSLNLTLHGAYSIGGQPVSPGAATVRVSGGALTFSGGGVSRSLGASFRLTRQSDAASCGVKISQGRAPGNLYPGDIQFTLQGGTLYVVVHVFMEDYLYGVLPYEMGNGSGLEALKAQAVAARTYTLKAMTNAAPSALYDLVDTTADQMYNGTPTGNENCRRAVDETQGIIVKNGSAFTATYYTASNGGQMESVRNAWDTAGPAYLSVRDDPYDLSNPDAAVKSFSVNASGSQSSAAVGRLLNNKAASAFGAGATVNAVYAVTPHSPKYALPSRVYDKLDFEVGYTLNGQTAAGILTFDIFSELEGPLGMSINSMKNELWSVTQSNGLFIISARRFGHGVGMSQRGAMQMARMGYGYDQILGFYYEGCQQVRYTFTRPGVQAPVPSAPTAAPQAQPALSPIAYAWVNTASGSLNLRQSPQANAQVLLTIPQYQRIPIYSRDDAWCQAEYNGTTGYVSSRYLSFDQEAPPPSALPAQTSPLAAQVTTAQGSLNLREEPKSGAKVITTIPQYDQVIVTDHGDPWCAVVYDGLTGYVMTKYLTFLGPVAVTPAPAQTVVMDPDMKVLEAPVQARVNTPLSSLNLREGCSTQSRILLEMPKYDSVTVYAVGGEWCAVSYNGQSGYCMTQYLEFNADE